MTLAVLASVLKSPAALQLENVALRHTLECFNARLRNAFR